MPDSFILLQSCVVVTGIHFNLSARWYKLVFMEMFAVVAYAVNCSCFVGEDDRYPSNAVYLALTMFVVALGKRQLEIHERLVFSTLLAEKTLPAEAEFRLSQSVDTQYSSSKDDGQMTLHRTRSHWQLQRVRMLLFMT